MWMTHGEIRTLYRNAKNQRREITILAELNACDEKEIIQILQEGNLIIPEKKKREQKKKENVEA